MRQLVFFDTEKQELHFVDVPPDGDAYAIERYIFWKQPSWIRLPVASKTQLRKDAR